MRFGWKDKALVVTFIGLPHWAEEAELLVLGWSPLVAKLILALWQASEN
ncbi:hypothetical protein P4S64_10955 [Vibrio sp. M60_M31a]